MSSYGWTLDQALDLTYPQIKTLYRVLMKWPTANMFVAAFVQQQAGRSDIDKLEQLKTGSVSKISSVEFGKRFGKTVVNIIAK